jgi:hypothetical protein
MPETRYKRRYERDGIVSQVSYEVTDEQLHQEALDAEFNDKSHQGLLAYNNWPNLTPTQKDTVLKNLLGFVLYREGML